MSTNKPTRALTRGLEVIQVLNERPSTPLSLLNERTGLSRATLLRILKTLDAAGWVYRRRADSHYRLASEVCRLGQHLRTADCLAERAAPVLDRLYQAVGWPSDLAVCTGYGMQILDSTRRARPEMGNHNPLEAPVPILWSALGRAYLAFCLAPEREAMLEHLRDSPAGWDQAVHDSCWLERLLEDTRARGYGVAEPNGCQRSRNGQRGLGAIAVPVRPEGRTRACLSLVWIEGEDSLDRMAANWLLTLRAAAQEITERLGRHAPQDAG